jgi:hypothetical protein
MSCSLGSVHPTMYLSGRDLTSLPKPVVNQPTHYTFGFIFQLDKECNYH